MTGNLAAVAALAFSSLAAAQITIEFPPSQSQGDQLGQGWVLDLCDRDDGQVPDPDNEHHGRRFGEPAVEFWITSGNLHAGETALTGYCKAESKVAWNAIAPYDVSYNSTAGGNHGDRHQWWDFAEGSYRVTHDPESAYERPEASGACGTFGEIETRVENSDNPPLIPLLAYSFNPAAAAFGAGRLRAQLKFNAGDDCDCIADQDSVTASETVAYGGLTFEFGLPVAGQVSFTPQFVSTEGWNESDFANLFTEGQGSSWSPTSSVSIILTGQIAAWCNVNSGRRNGTSSGIGFIEARVNFDDCRSYAEVSLRAQPKTSSPPPGGGGGGDEVVLVIE